MLTSARARKHPPDNEEEPNPVMNRAERRAQMQRAAQHPNTSACLDCIADLDVVQFAGLTVPKVTHDDSCPTLKAMLAGRA